jgi:hypothetical protein
MLFTCVAPHTESKGLPIDGPLLIKKLILFTCVALHTKSKGLPIGDPLLSKKLMLFTRVSPHTKSKWLPIDGPLLSKKLILFTCVASHTKTSDSRSAVPYSVKKTYSFYMRSITYKKQGASDRRSLIRKKEKKREREEYAFYTRSTVYKKHGAPDRRSTHPLLLSECASSRIKSKGLRRYAL